MEENKDIQDTYNSETIKDQRQLLKDSGEYTGENLIKIDGTGNKILSILHEYIKYIDSGYDLTLEDICNYLKCSDNYFRANYRDSIKHIRINSMVRDAFFTAINREDIILSEEDLQVYLRLFLKRILYNYESFSEFILSNCMVEHKYKRFSLKDFYIKMNTYQEEISITATLNSISDKLYGQCNEGILKPIDYIPEELESLKTCLKVFGYKYDIDLYRRIEQQGVNKIRLGNLVRYDLKDFDNRNWIKVNYVKWEKLGSKKVIDSILKVYNS